ncbi:hypothetical protein [Radiobacillus sp. PE A8.2]|uniref:hypothetical protein n=1 Tax=Radiobacillus sp. PE A8.2 TaxID=3380349 RepID=UPI00388D15BD
MIKEKRSFDEKCSNNWICTLKQVKELKKALLSKTTEEVRLWSDGSWTCSKGNEPSRDNGEPLYILTKNDLRHISQDTIDSSLYSICHLIFGLDHPLKDQGVRKYPLKRKNTDSNSFLQNGLFINQLHSYHFVFACRKLDFKCTIMWESSNRYLLIKLGDGTIGFAKDIRHIINYLFDLSKKLPHDFRSFPLFWEEIKKFEDYYCNSITDSISPILRPTKEIMVKNEYPWERHGNYSKISDFISHFSLDIPIPQNVNVEKYIDMRVIFFLHDRIYGYENDDNEALAYIMLMHIEDNPLEPFEIMKEKCIYTNSYKISLAKDYLIEWNYSEECFKANAFNEECKYFSNTESLIKYLLSITNETKGNDKKDFYYNKIEKLAYAICKDSNDTSEYKDLVKFISNYEQWKLWSDDLPF